jgi:hypothetical protein
VKSLNFNLDHAPVLGRAANRRGGARTREVTLRPKGGKASVYLDTSRAIWEPSGQVIRYQGTLVDERREMERQLRRQEELFTAFAGESDARPHPGD